MSSSTQAAPAPAALSEANRSFHFRAWLNVVLGALLMLATMPGRTQGLGLITEPMLRDLNLDRVVYANINLWATLLGSLACFPAGWLLDRFGLRMVSALTVLLLGAVVWRMSEHAGSVALLFIMILLTRAIGQSALSVASITAVAKSFGQKKVGFAMSVYSILMSLMFFAGFSHVGQSVRTLGWRTAWMEIAIALLIISPLVLALLANPRSTASTTEKGGLTLHQALRTPAFWVFAGAASMFGLVSSGLGLFNEAVLAERGFDRATYHKVLANTTMISLGGQFICGALTLRWPMQRLLGVAMFLYAIALCYLTFVKTMSQLWTFAAIAGLSGGMITVLFFAVWRKIFGPEHVGRIQGRGQMVTVLASAIGPIIFAKSAAILNSYSPILLALSPIVLLFGVAAWRTKTDTIKAA